MVNRPPPTFERKPAPERTPIGIDPAIITRIKGENQQNEVDANHASTRQFEIVSDKKNVALEVVKAVGIIVLWIGAVVLLWTLGIAFLGGALWVGGKSFLWLLKIYGLVMGVCLLILPLLFFRATRAFVGLAYVCASYVFGLTTWVWSLLLAYSYWGWVGLIIGLFFMGVGVFPVALLACMFHGNWSTTGQLLVAGILIYVARGLGVFFASLGEKE
jgi:hypothetical protein